MVAKFSVIKVNLLAYLIHFLDEKPSIQSIQKDENYHFKNMTSRKDFEENSKEADELLKWIDNLNDASELWV